DGRLERSRKTTERPERPGAQGGGRRPREDPAMSPTADFPALAAACQEVPPLAAVVLGSGMGQVAAGLRPLLSVPVARVLGLPASSVAGHKGRLTLGDWAGRRVLLFEGRLHYYEGHSWAVVTRPMEFAADLGARVALLTNAAGGIRADLDPG